VEYFPRWLAPNLITLVGLIALVGAYLVSGYYYPSLEGMGSLNSRGIAILLVANPGIHPPGVKLDPYNFVSGLGRRRTPMGVFSQWLCRAVLHAL
jgi:hypothetical protein